MTTTTPAGTVAIGGERAPYDYWFDRNALAHVRATSHGIVAVTASGHLLRFDPDTLAPAGEAIASPPIRCLSDGSPLYAGADGAIEVIDAATLGATTIASVDGAPTWIATYANGARLAVVAVRERDVRVHRFELRDRRALGAITVPRRDLPGRPGSWFLDHEDRLWYGVDGGEWGGMVGRIDLATGRVSKIDGITEPVMGFAAIDRVVWAYGGITHMGMTEGFVAEIAGDTAKMVWRKGNFPKATLDPPGLPVVAAWQAGARIRVVVWRELYEVSRDLKSWKRVATINAHARGGRPDAVGSYPAVRDLAMLGGDVVVATGYDGLFRIHGNIVEHHAIADQLSARINAIATTGAGTFVRELYTSGAPWRPDHQRWYAIDIEPLGDDIYGYELVARPGHAPWILAERTDGEGIVARWRGSGFARLARSKDVSRGAIAIGDDLWALHGGKIWRFDHDWIEVGTYDGELGYGIQGIDDSGLVIVRGEHAELARLAIDGPTHAHLVRAIGHAAVRDVVADGDRVVVATPDGLHALDGDRLAPSPLPALADVAHLARDDHGRIWQGSDRLAFVDPATSKLQPVDLPMLRGRPIEALAYDPATHQLLVGLGASGLVRLQLR